MWVPMSAGKLELNLFPERLLPGARFRTQQAMLSFTLRLGGASKPEWSPIGSCAFDGSAFTVTVKPVVFTFRKRDFAEGLSMLGATNDLVLALPSTSLQLSATPHFPTASGELGGSVLLLLLNVAAKGA